jgi:hypothetical protein
MRPLTCTSIKTEKVRKRKCTGHLRSNKKERQQRKRRRIERTKDSLSHSEMSKTRPHTEPPESSPKLHNLFSMIHFNIILQFSEVFKSKFYMHFSFFHTHVIYFAHQNLLDLITL